MAILLSVADGYLMSGTLVTATGSSLIVSATPSWGVVEPTSFQGTPNTAVTATNTITTLVTGTSFTLASSVIVAGVALQLSGRAASPTGTLNVQLYDVTGAAILAQVTINISDLPNSNGVGNNHIDWTYFKFASPVTTIAGRSYAIRTQTSVGSQYSYYYTTGTTNTNRALVTTTNQAPVAGDQLIIAGSYTSAGVNTTTTITLNDRIQSMIPSNVWISSKGIATFYSPATNPANSAHDWQVSIAGFLVIGVGGSLLIGTQLSPIPQNQSIQLVLQPTTALQYTFLVYGTFKTYGSVYNSVGSGNPSTPQLPIAAKLVTDVPTGATSSTTSIVTGWGSQNTVIFTSTSRTYTEYELVSLLVGTFSSSGTKINHNPITYAHGGNETTKVQGDVVNITRTISIGGWNYNALAATKTNIQIFASAVVSFNYTSFSGLGTGTTITTSGICVNALNTGYTFDIQYCTLTDNQFAANSTCIALNVASTIGTTISNNIFFGLGWSATVVNTLNLLKIDDGNYIIGCLSTTQVLLATTMGSNNVFSSNNTPAATGFVNNASNNSFYSNNTIGLNIVNPPTTGNLNLTNFLIWRNNTFGLRFEISGVGYQRNNIISFNGLYCFGNTTASITVLGRVYEKIYFYNSFFYGGTTLVQPTHITNSNSISVDAFYYHNCYLGYSDTSLTTSPFGSGFLFNGFFNNVSTIFSNCYFNGSLNQTGFYLGTNLNGNMISLNHNGVTGSNRQWVDIGNISTDFVIYKSPPKSLRITTQGAWTIRITSPLVKVPVKSGTTCTISVFVRKSITADGAVNNSTQPRLMYAFNPVLGNPSETIGDKTKNLFQYPQNFENVRWNKTAMTITPDSVSVAAPDGTFTADLFVEDNTTNRHRLLLNGIVLTSGTYTFSIYAKSAAQDWIQLNPVANNWSGDWANFNLSTGTIGNTGSGTIASITNAGNGWWRISIVSTLTSTGANEFPVICLSTNNTNSGTYPSYTGTNAQCFYIWGAQLTSGSTLLPYYDNGQWEQLTYTAGTFSNDGVAEFYVDCDGYLGFVNIDDWSVDTSVDSRGQDYWGVNATYVEPDFKRGTRSYTFVK